MYALNNLFDNKNIRCTHEMGPVRILEHILDFNMSHAPDKAYFRSKMNIHKRQALITLNDSSFITSAGAMQWTLGEVAMSADVKGVGDFVGKLFAGQVTKQTPVKPKYEGRGYLMLEPTYMYLFPIQVEEWGAVTLEDGLFLGCEGTVQQSLESRKNLSSLLGGEGLFNLCLSGDGVALLQSPVPYETMVEVKLQNDEIRIDGNMAIAWSSSLSFTVERSSKSLMALATSGEGFVNVYRGTGKVLMALV